MCGQKNEEFNLSTPLGQNLRRIDGQEKVTGGAVYTGDLKLPGMIYGKVLRSLLPHARICRIDAQKAESHPGVIAILTRENLEVVSTCYGASVKDQPVVALEKVRYVGDVVAAVAAVEEGIAEEALKLIEVDYEELPAVFSVEDAIKQDAPLVHEKLEGPRNTRFGRGGSHIIHENSNICFHFRNETGDIKEGFKAADIVLEDSFFFPSAHHYAMEPHVSVADFTADMLTVWSSTQTPFPVRQELARVFGLPYGRVRLIVPYVGGGYGSKSGIKTEALAAALSRLAQRPVKLALRSEESFHTICQPGTEVRIKTGVKKDGSLVARQCEIYINGGAYSNSGVSLTAKSGYRAHGPYRIPHVLTDAYYVYTNTVPGGAFRGFGAPQVIYAYDSHLDMVAHRLKMDPLDLRLKNILGKGDEYSPGNTPIDCDLKAGLRKVADLIDWGKKDQTKIKSGVKRGKGIACGVIDGGGTNKAAHSTVRILMDGSTLLSFGSVEFGQGIRTALLQVVAEELSLPPEDVYVTQLDTQSTPFDRGTNATSAVSVMGQAVQLAAADARGQLIAAAASVLEVDLAMIRLEGGKVVAVDKTLSFRDVMRSYYGDSEGEIMGKGYFKVPRNDAVPIGYPAPFWEISIVGAEVEVDEMTGQVKIDKYVSLTDAGKMINPILCRGQDEGATLFGIGLSLLEELHYSEGQLANPNLVDYRIPRFRDLPDDFETRILEEQGGPGPHGAKGLGEGGVLAVAPAVCNAVYNATGVRMQRVPLLGERMWRAIEEHRRGQRKR